MYKLATSFETRWFSVLSITSYGEDFNPHVVRSWTGFWVLKYSHYTFIGCVIQILKYNGKVHFNNIFRYATQIFVIVNPKIWLKLTKKND